MLSIDEARTRVARGAAHLDRVRPGWHNRIDIGTLTLHDPCGCIVGQLCGPLFNLGVEALLGDAFDESWQRLALTHGFDMSSDEGGVRNDPVSYRPLQDAWIEAIADRRLADQHVEQEAVHVSANSL